MIILRCTWFLVGLVMLIPRIAAAEPAKAAPNAPGLLWRSGVMTAATPGRAVDFDIDLRGAKKIWLVVEDNGSFDMDWAAWVNPRFVGPAGERLLTEIDWRSATAEWGQVRKDRNAAGGPIRVAGREERGIGTHATSVIEFDMPEGMTGLLGRVISCEPVDRSQSCDAIEFLRIVGDEHGIDRLGVGGDHQVVGADELAALLEVGPDRAV